MQFTDLTSNAVECALSYPLDNELKCCLKDDAFIAMQVTGACGTIACPFYKPLGKADWVRRENAREVWFEELPEDVKAKQMSAEEYKLLYARLRDEEDDEEESE